MSFFTIRYLKDSNGQLLNNSGKVTDVAAQNVKAQEILVTCLPIIAAFIALILLILLIISVYRRLLAPINQLYKGMAEIGITGADIEVPEEHREVTPLFIEVKNVFNRFNSLIQLIENLNKNIPFKDILGYIYKAFSQYIPYTYIGVALIGDDRNTIKASFAASDKQHAGLSKKMLGYSTSINRTSLGSIIDSGKERIINDLEKYSEGKPLKEYNRILLEEGIRASITFPLKTNDKPIGIIFFSSNQKFIYKKEHVEFLRTLADSIVLGLEKSILMDDMIVGSVKALARLAEQRDPETGEHLNRMSMYSRVLAERLSVLKKYENIIDQEYINNIERFSPLHDIGKVGIRDEILLKPDKLTGEEFAIMKTHTIYGAWVLKMAEENIQKSGRSIFNTSIEIAEGHHEKWDGSGYPHGKAGLDIPLSARIVAVADVFDALTSKRPYKEPFSYEESCRIIIESSGRHFDPDIVDVFVNDNDKIKEAYNGFKERGIL
jgi:HD-GYP domain-containing protein (c-di-GMP phosphodiesterase class II)